jgi:hypothetical protein
MSRVNRKQISSNIYVASSGTSTFSHSGTGTSVITNCSTNYSTVSGRLLEVILVSDGSGTGNPAQIATNSTGATSISYIDLEVNASSVQRIALGLQLGTANEQIIYPPGSVRFIYQATINGSATYRLTASNLLAASTIQVRFCRMIIREIN